MGTSLQFTLPYPPSANAYWRSVGRKVLVSAEARAFKQVVAVLLLRQRIRPLLGDVEVAVRIFRPRRAGDLDNTLKVLLDAMKGLAFGDDDQVVKIAAERFDDKDSPRAEVTVTERP